MINAGLPNLKDMSPEELETFIAGLGKERYRARQILKCLYRQGATSFDQMTTLSRVFREELSRRAVIDTPRIVETRTAGDTTKKVLFRLDDGNYIESVLIPGKTHWTICVSTQVGCRMGCRFCLTGKQGFTRNLRPSEITGQVMALRTNMPEGPEIRNIVLMGMGEPLDNYDNVVKAIRVLTSDHAFGFSTRKITLSTCGIAPMILKLGEDICVNIAVSLNAPDDRLRSDLMPINRKYPLAELFAACRDYPMPGRRMVTFEYILIGGVNDSLEDAARLVRLLKGTRCKLNLIAFNEFPGSPFKGPSPEAVAAFQSYLAKHHYTAILRVSKGSDILAACGQLSGQYRSE
jgi:23S rRNA (adenine2503-C2)-methyltransferase